MLDPNSSEKEFISQMYVGETCSDVQFEYKEFDSCTFKECDFSNTTFSNCKFIECEFINCNLSIVKLNYSRFSETVFKECKVIGVDWTKAAWSNLSLPSPVSFYTCVMNDSSFFGLSMTELVLEDCKVRDVDFREGSFNESDFSGSDFSNSLFSGSNLSSTNFEGAENYYIDLHNTNINSAKFSRLEAVNLLESLDIELLD